MNNIASTTTTISGEYTDILFDRSELSHGIINGIFNKCSFTRADFRHATIKNAVFDECNFTLIDGCYTLWENCTFNNCNVYGAEFKRAEFINCMFDGTPMTPDVVDFDVYTIMNNCVIDRVPIPYDQENMNSIHKLDGTIYSAMRNSAKNMFGIVMNIVKEKLESENASEFMLYLLSKVGLGYKSQSRYDEDIVNYAIANPSGEKYTVNELRESYVRLLRLTYPIYRIMDYFRPILPNYITVNTIMQYFNDGGYIDATIKKAFEVTK